MRLWFNAITHDEDGESTDHGELRSGVAVGDLPEAWDDVMGAITANITRPSVIEVRIRVAP